MAQRSEGRIDRCLFPCKIRGMHFFEGAFEALAAPGIHRKEGECLREWHTIHTPVQKLNVCIHFPKSCAENYFAECSLRNCTLHKQSRSPCQ